MNVANLELCKELHELSVWDDTVWFHFKGHLYTSHELRGQTVGPGWEPVPAYDLGYLLRKLPRYLEFQGKHEGDFLLKLMPLYDGSTWRIEYAEASDDWMPFCVDADTPENAVAKLAIELFKQKIITREVGDDVA